MELSSDIALREFLRSRRIETVRRERFNPSYLQRKLFYAPPGAWRRNQMRLHPQQERETA